MVNIFKIVLTGPESSGKSQMAKALASYLGVYWVPEFARFYLSHLGRPYRRLDLKSIGRGQSLWEQWFEIQTCEGRLQKEPAKGQLKLKGTAANKILVLDTDWTVLQIWEQYVYARHEPPLSNACWQQGYGTTKNADLYLLCAPDLVWEPDPLREHPEARDDLFKWYEALLQKSGAPYVVLRGEHEKRLRIALEALTQGLEGIKFP